MNAPRDTERTDAGTGAERVALPEPVAWGVWDPSHAHKPDDLTTYADVVKDWRLLHGDDDVRDLFTRAQLDQVRADAHAAGMREAEGLVVAWLREMAAHGATHLAGYALSFAQAITRGDHR